MEKGYALEKYPALWDKFGDATGPKRNQQMAEIADAAVVFWDGQSAGSKNMIECADKKNIPCKIISVQ